VFPLVHSDVPADVVSDNEIAVRLHQRIAELGHHITGRIVIRVHKGTVTVQGAVQSSYQKLLVISCLKHIRSDLVVRDRIEMIPARSIPVQKPRRNKLLHKNVRFCAAAAAAVTVVVAFMWLRPTVSDRGLIAVPVSVRAAGEPADGALLTLYPADQGPPGNTAESVRPQGRVSEDGSVIWTTFEPADGLLPGNYVVTAVWSRLILADGEMQPGPNVLPVRYESPESSPVRLTVAARSSEHPAGKILLNFE